MKPFGEVSPSGDKNMVNLLKLKGAIIGQYILSCGFSTIPRDSKCHFIFAFKGKTTLNGKRCLLKLPSVFKPAPAILVCRVLK